MKKQCAIAECHSPGKEILPGVVLCRYHRKRCYHRLCDIYQAELRDRDAKQVAHEAAGERRPRMEINKGSGVWETSGGLPTLGKNR